MQLSLEDIEILNKNNPLEPLQDVPIEQRDSIRNAIDGLAAKYVTASDEDGSLDDFQSRLALQFGQELTSGMKKRSHEALYWAKNKAHDNDTGRSFPKLRMPESEKPGYIRDDAMIKNFSDFFQFTQKEAAGVARRYVSDGDIADVVSKARIGELKNWISDNELIGDIETARINIDPEKARKGRQPGIDRLRDAFDEAYRKGNPKVRELYDNAISAGLSYDEQIGNRTDKALSESAIGPLWNSGFTRWAIRGMASGGNHLLSMVSGNGEYSENADTGGEATAAQNRTGMGEVGRFLENAGASAVDTTIVAGTGAAVGGPLGLAVPASILAGSYSSGKDAYHAARKAGLSEGAAQSFAVRNAGFEAGFAILGNKLFGLGFEKIFAKDALPALKSATKLAIAKRAGIEGLKAIGEELPGELVTSIAQNLDSKFSGVDPEANEHIVEDIADTIAQTVLGSGAGVSAKSVFQGTKDYAQAYRSASPELQDAIRKIAESLPENPSRKQAAELGIQGNAAERAQAAKEIKEVVAQPVETPEPAPTQEQTEVPPAVAEETPATAQPEPQPEIPASEPETPVEQPDAPVVEQAPTDFVHQVMEQNDYILAQAKTLAQRAPSLDAEDIAQNVIVKALEKWNTFDPSKGTIKQWITGIIRSEFGNAGREAAKAKAELPEDPPSDQPAPGSQAYSKMEIAGISKAEFDRQITNPLERRIVELAIDDFAAKEGKKRIDWRGLVKQLKEEGHGRVSRETAKDLYQQSMSTLQQSLISQGITNEDFMISPYQAQINANRGYQLDTQSLPDVHTPETVRGLSTPFLLDIVRDLGANFVLERVDKGYLGAYAFQGDQVRMHGKLVGPTHQGPGVPIEEFAAGVLAHEIGHLNQSFTHDPLTGDSEREAPRGRDNIKGISKAKDFVSHIMDIRRQFKAFIPNDMANPLYQQALNLSAWWSSQFPSHNKNFLSYRMRGREIHADMVSVLLTAPGEMQRRAPDLWKAFWDHANRRKPFMDAYNKIQEILRGPTPHLSKIEGMYERGRQGVIDAQIRMSDTKERINSKQRKLDWFKRLMYDTTQAVSGRALDRGDYEAYDSTQELKTSDSVRSYFLANFKRIEDDLAKAGINRDEFSAFMQARRNIERTKSGKANPNLFMDTSSKKMLSELATRIGPDGMDLLAKKHDHLVQMIRPYLEDLHNEGFLSDGTMDSIRKNRYYATFWVTKFAEDSLKNVPGFKAVKGTTSDILPPFEAMAYKFASVADTLARVKANNRAGTIGLQELADINATKAPGDPDLKLARVPWSDRNKLQKQIDANGTGIVQMWEDGKPYAQEVMRDIADAVKSGNGAFLDYMQKVSQLMYKVIYPLHISWNFSRASTDLWRDGVSTYLKLKTQIEADSNGKRTLGLNEFRKYWSSAIAPAYSYASNEYTKNEPSTPATYLKKIYAAIGEKLDFDHNRAANEVLDALKMQAISTTYRSSYDVTKDLNSDADMMDWIYKRQGLDDKPLKTWNPLQVMKTMLESVEDYQAFSQALPKFAAIGILRDHGYSPQRIGTLTRELAGNPDTRRAGIGRIFFNLMSPYSNAKLQDQSSQFRFLADKKSRRFAALNQFKYAVGPVVLKRLIMGGFLIPAAMAAVKAAGSNPDDNWLVNALTFFKRFNDKQNEYQRNYGMAIPFSEYKDENGVTQFRSVSLPHPPINANAAITTETMLDALMDGDRHRDLWALGDSYFKALLAANVINLREGPASLPSKYIEAATGGNPHDDFMDRDIIPENERVQGKRLRAMTEYTLAQTGVLEKAIRAMGLSDFLYHPDSPYKDRYKKNDLLKTFFSGFIRDTGGNFTAQQKAEFARVKMKEAAFKDGLPKSYQELSDMHNRLKSIIENGTPDNTTKVSKTLLDGWASEARKIIKQIKEANENLDMGQVRKLTEELRLMSEGAITAISEHQFSDNRFLIEEMRKMESEAKITQKGLKSAKDRDGYLKRKQQSRIESEQIRQGVSALETR